MNRAIAFLFALVLVAFALPLLLVSPEFRARFQ